MASWPAPVSATIRNTLQSLEHTAQRNARQEMIFDNHATRIGRAHMPAAPILREGQRIYRLYQAPRPPPRYLKFVVRPPNRRARFSHAPKCQNCPAGVFVGSCRINCPHRCLYRKDTTCCPSRSSLTRTSESLAVPYRVARRLLADAQKIGAQFARKSGQLSEMPEKWRAPGRPRGNVFERVANLLPPVRVHVPVRPADRLPRGRASSRQ